MKRPIKLINPTYASLFDILSLGILADIDIWLSGLDQHNKFKHIISRFKYMSNPILFAISYDLCNTYHNFGDFRWYNKVQYDWSHQLILDRDGGYWKHYEYHMNKSKYITQLTPQLLIHRELCK